MEKVGVAGRVTFDSGQDIDHRAEDRDGIRAKAAAESRAGPTAEHKSDEDARWVHRQRRHVGAETLPLRRSKNIHLDVRKVERCYCGVLIFQITANRSNR